MWLLMSQHQLSAEKPFHIPFTPKFIIIAEYIGGGGNSKCMWHLVHY